MSNKISQTSTGLQEYKQVSDLPEDLRQYTLIMMDKNTYSITGDVKNLILESKTNFVELPTGDVINKAVISQIQLDRETTVDNFKRSNALL